MGNPNVGKSAIFSRLTGARVALSNYPGTTVEFTQGQMKIGKSRPIMLSSLEQKEQLTLPWRLRHGKLGLPLM